MKTVSVHSPQIIAHRGASRAEHENTVAAFRRAGALGADAVELDVRALARSPHRLAPPLVVHHDALLADGRALGDLGAGDVPAHVPTLDAALDACSPLWVNVEIKNAEGEAGFDPTDGIADAVVAALRARPEPAATWLISSFRMETVDRCRAVEPEIRTAWLTVGGPELATRRGIDSVVELVRERGHQALHPFYAYVTAELVHACHDAGLALNAWTCDEPERMQEMARWGVDGICTNVPDVALAALRRPGGSRAEGPQD